MFENYVVTSADSYCLICTADNDFNMCQFVVDGWCYTKISSCVLVNVSALKYAPGMTSNGNFTQILFPTFNMETSDSSKFIYAVLWHSVFKKDFLSSLQSKPNVSVIGHGVSNMPYRQMVVPFTINAVRVSEISLSTQSERTLIAAVFLCGLVVFAVINVCFQIH